MLKFHYCAKMHIFSFKHTEFKKAIENYQWINIWNFMKIEVA